MLATQRSDDGVIIQSELDTPVIINDGVFDQDEL